MYQLYYILNPVGMLMLGALIYLLFSHHSLKRRLGRLERQLKAREGAADAAQGAASPASAEPPDVPEASPQPVEDTPDPQPAPLAAERREEATEDAATPPNDLPAPRSFVFRRDRLAELGGWIRENWFFAMAALSLALAAVFLVQYGVENGVLTPFWRVMSALALGTGLVVVGEVLRRRFGDDTGGPADYLPSTFAGAGLFGLFAAVLSARRLYDLIGAETALGGLVAVSALAVVLGWYYGPLLAAVGIVGAVAAPFFVGGSSEAADLLFYYFALVGIAGLLVDAIKRWAWISALVLIACFAAAALLFASGAGAQHYLAFGLIMTVAAAIIPPLNLSPSHGGPSLLGTAVALALKRKGTTMTWPEFPTRLASGTFIATTLTAVVVAERYGGGAVEIWMAFAVLILLFLGATLWMWQAEALEDVALWPGLAFLYLIYDQGADYGLLYRDFIAELPPETSAPLTVSLLAALGLGGSILGFWRSVFAARNVLAWSILAALLAPLTIVALEMAWNPTPVLGAGTWALHVMGVAAVMVFFAERSYRHGGVDAPLRSALFAMAALCMISLALMLMLSAIALTLALGVMVLLAVLIDRRFDLAPMTVFIQLGAVVIGWRLLADPGVFWATERAQLWEVILAYGGSILLLGAAWTLLQARARTAAMVVLESAIWTFASLLVVILLYRAFGSDLGSHWGMSLAGLVWLISMFNQLYRLKTGGWMRWLRGILAALFGLIGTGFLIMGLIFFNPLESKREVVLGPLVFDSLMVAYLSYALLFAVVAWKFTHFTRGWRISFAVLSALFAAYYLGLEIRSFWQGPVLANRGVMQGELYSYTLAMLIASALLLFVAFSRRSVALRRLAILGIGLTIAKVFVIDMSGLTGLVRVASFLGLGVSLAGLAWINRHMTRQWDAGRSAGGDEDE